MADIQRATAEASKKRRKKKKERKKKKRQGKNIIACL